MRVFDFDGTLYDGDSTVDFYRFALKRHPTVLKAMPRQLGAAFRYAFKWSNLEGFKERFYSFLSYLPDIDTVVTEFWDTHQNRLKASVVERVQPGDVIASASPAFLLTPIARQLGADLIASEVDSQTGRLLGPNCRDQAKRQRLIDAGLEGKIEEFYSDSAADAPCVALAARGILVHGNELTDYPW